MNGERPETVRPALRFQCPGETTMAIKEQISKDMAAAMKAKDSERLGVLRMMRAEILNKEKEKKEAEVGDPEVVSLLQKMVRQRREAADEFRAGGREDRAEKELAEISVIEQYLPAAIPEDEVKALIEKTVEESGAVGPKDMGKVMGQVMKALKEDGRTVDGGKVNAMVREALSGKGKEE
jgi:uncharacterized protein YqeY